MQPIIIQFAVRVRKDYTPLNVYLGCVWVVFCVKYITYEGLLHVINTLALEGPFKCYVTHTGEGGGVTFSGKKTLRRCKAQRY